MDFDASTPTDTHAANGSLTSDGVFSYAYDTANQLTNVVRTTDGARVLSARYDALGRRVEATRADGSVERYVYFPGSFLVLAVLDGTNAVKEIYTRGPDLSGSLDGAGGIGGILACTYASGATYYSHADIMGNVIALTDASGSVAATFRYTPFGQLSARTGSILPRYLFSSKEFDRTANLYYYGYRYYAPRLGRWMTRDPLEEADGEAIYTMCANAPLYASDAWGLSYNPDKSDELSRFESPLIHLSGNPDIGWKHTTRYMRRNTIYKGHSREYFGALDRWLVYKIQNAIVEKVDACCARIKRGFGALLITEIEIIDQRYIGKPGSVTLLGWAAVHGHEYRRVQSVLLATTCYFTPVVGEGSDALKCGIVCDDKGADVAAEKLWNYLNSIFDSASKQVDRYVYSQRQKITDNEPWVLKGNLHDYHSSIHKLDAPPPQIPHECPK